MKMRVISLNLILKASHTFRQMQRRNLQKLDSSRR